MLSRINELRLFRPRRATFECCEERTLMAGDVAVSTLGGNLIIQGDNRDSWVVVETGASPGQYIVTEKPTSPNSGTFAVHTVDGVTGGLRVTLAGGRDSLYVFTSFEGDVVISLGEGVDTLIFTGQPQAHVHVKGDLSISTGGGDDSMRIESLDVSGDHLLNMGGGKDEAFYGFNEFNQVGPATVHESFLEGITVAGTFLANFGDGDDSLRLFASSAGTALSINGGGGKDALHLASVSAKSISLIGGVGNDSIFAEHVATSGLFASLGGGDDALLLGDVRSSLTVVSGDAGNDTLYNLSGLVAGGTDLYDANRLGVFLALGLEQKLHTKPVTLTGFQFVAE